MITRCLFVFFVSTALYAAVAAEPDPRTVPLADENPKYLQVDLPVDERVADLIGRMTLAEKAIALNHNGPDLERFGLRSDKWNQCLNGVQWDRPTTLFPSCIAMAATWDTDLIENYVAKVLSDEARAIYNQWRMQPDIRSQHKGLIYRDPVINIGRNPYWGRNHEAWGEDPFLTGRMGVAYVKGLQGDDPRYLKIAATLKHYAVNNVETERFRLDAKVSQRMLHEYWLPHFRDSVIEAHASSLMASYNGVNGTPNNINHWLLTDLLKQRWNHAGFVVSDLGGVRTMVQGHEQNRMSYVDAVAESLMAGCDFSGKEYQQYIPQAVEAGKLTEQRLDDALRRVLTVRFRLGEFDPHQSVSYHTISPDIIACDDHRAVARKVARKSIVLLQNRDAILPLDKTALKRLAVIGPLADQVVLNNYNGRHENLVTPLAGIRKHVGDDVEVAFAPGGKIRGANEEIGTQIDREEEFSGGESLKLESSTVGEFIEFSVRVESAGQYALELQYKSFPSRGQFQMSVDGKDIGEPIDMYRADARYGQTAVFGERELAAGPHQVRFTVVGKSRASQGLTGHFDQLRLRGPSDQEIELERAEYTTGRAKSTEDPIQQAVKTAANADCAILFVGTDQTVEQEGRDRTSLGLPGDQLKLVQAVFAANPRTIVVLGSAGPLTVPWVKQEIPAVLQAWWGGEEGGTAIADILFGTVNPAGRLPHTVYASESQVPPLDQYNIDAGFTYMYLRGKPLYAFGHGLSYTKFAYDKLSVSMKQLTPAGKLTIDMEVDNVGERAGDEVVQLYVRRVDSEGQWPRIQLCGFTRLQLKPGETQDVRFNLPAKQLSRFDELEGDFVIKPGRYEILVGRSSAEMLLRSKFKIVAE